MRALQPDREQYIRMLEGRYVAYSAMKASVAHFGAHHDLSIKAAELFALAEREVQAHEAKTGRVKSCEPQL